MLHIDAREGLSSDMLLAALIGLLEKAEADSVSARMQMASERYGLRFLTMPIEEEGDRGLAISYCGGNRSSMSVSYDEAHSMLADICAVLGEGTGTSAMILQRIFEAEAEAHRMPVREVHLHEIGRPEALLNIAGIGHVHGLVSSPGESISCSTITTGRGTVATSHGVMKVPAPATAHLLRGLRHVPGEEQGERATPSGVAAISVISAGHSDDYPKAPTEVGVGFGTKRFDGRLGRVIIRRP